MDPIVISATIQEFNGIRYYRCGSYFQRKGARLHRMVWEYNRGPIPYGYHVHHRDNDRSRNMLDNLECITMQGHLGDRHGAASGERGRTVLPKARAAASKWHRSDEGREWHRAHYERRLRAIMDAPRVPAVCEQCGGSYMAAAMHVEYAKFCGPNCRAKAFRRRHRGD